jgi:hypothetical protein
VREVGRAPVAGPFLDVPFNGESGSSAYNNMSSANFLKSLATDASHFYNTPKTMDLTAIFNSIGAALASGSRLVSCGGC